MDLGQLLLDRGLVSPQELHDALAEQRRAILEGKDPVPRLGEILVARGAVTEKQVTEALGTQQKAILHCPACKVQVNVELRHDAAGYRCGTCGGPLIAPPEVKNVHVVDTSVILVAREPLPQEVQFASKDPARRFGKYVLLSEIGRGGLAIVHRAWDTFLNQYVALKFIRPPDGDRGMRREERIVSLLKEARSAIRLRHPNIVTLYDIGRIDRQFYIAMDCLDGSSLAGVIRTSRERGHPSPLYEEPRRMVAALRDAARAVHYAHTRQPPLIHCDIKPSNVFVDTQWKPFVLDFGLARHLNEEPDGGMGTSVRGTPAYMSPEQASGRVEEIDARTDVYGLGAILYELLAGRPPFGGPMPDLLRRIAREEPVPPLEVAAASQTTRPPESMRPGDLAIWPALERACLRALKKSRADRHSSAREMADELDRLLKGDSAISPAVAPKIRMPTPKPQPALPNVNKAVAAPPEPAAAGPRRRWRAFAGAAAGVLVAGVVFLLWPRGPRTEEERIRGQLSAIGARIDTQIAALQLEQAQRSLAEAGALAPASARAWLEDGQEDAEWIALLRDHLVEAINRARVTPANFRLRERELPGVVLLHATREKLVVFVNDRAGEIPWGAVAPPTIAHLVATLLLGAGRVEPADRLGLGIYCARNGMPEPARAQFKALAGTDLEIIGRRHLARLDAKGRSGYR